MVSCDICGRSVKSIILKGSTHNLIHYCDLCWYDKNPPVLVLTKLWNPPRYDSNNVDSELGNLFSPKAGKRVYPVKGQMVKCGFRLFNRKIFFEKEINEKYKEVFVFKYSGFLRCRALKEYKAWPMHMKLCDKIGCYLY